MSAPNQRPTLQGQRIKTRKRDEKEKYDPSAFRDAILQGFKETEGNLEQVSKFLDGAGSKLDYRRYAETLCDILFAGGILAPGGSIEQDPDTEYYKTDICVFGAPPEFEEVKKYYEVFYKLIRRYKYVEKSFEAELKKLIVFLKGFTQEQREKLAISVGICLANGLGNATCLQALFEDHLVKDDLSLPFFTRFTESFLLEKDWKHFTQVLKRANIDENLLKLFPINKRTVENFEAHFKTAGLQQICDYQRSKATQDLKKALQKRLEEMLEEEEPVKEMTGSLLEQMKKHQLPEHEVVVMTWSTVMNAMEFSKKDDLVAEQAIKHLRTHAPLFKALCTTGRSQLALLVKMQEYCYENTTLMQAFQKLVILFYKVDVITEEAVLKWFHSGASSKGKRVFLEQMKKFVEWLENAEEESDEEEEGEADQ